MRALIVLVLCGWASTAAAERAVVFVIDRSGSMQGPRLEAARTAVLAGIDALKPNDMVCVVAFDSEAQILIKAQPAKNKKQIKTDLAKLLAGGGTNYLPGLTQARDVMKDLKATKKLVMMLSDGEAASEGIAEVVKEMRDAKVTTSAVGISGADRNLLTVIANAGGGRLFMIDDISALPKVFAKEVREGLR